MRRTVILILLFFCQSRQIIFAQTRVIDSLRHILSTTISEKQKAVIYLALCDEKASITPDSLLYYAIQIKKIATNIR